MPMLGAWIYRHFCTSEVLRESKFLLLSPCEGPTSVVVICGWSMLLSSFALLVFPALFRTCAHTIPFLLFIVMWLNVGHQSPGSRGSFEALVGSLMSLFGTFQQQKWAVTLGREGGSCVQLYLVQLYLLLGHTGFGRGRV